jgi:uncharacterized protein (TIGR03437 family)
MKPPVLFSPLLLAAAVMLSSAVRLPGQDTPLVCQVASVALQVRAEGRTERVGDITISCTGGTPGQTGRTNLVLFLTRPITNPLVSNILRDVTVSVDQGSGLRPAPAGATVQSPTSLTFNGIDFAVPPSRTVLFRVSGVRVDVSGSAQPVSATLSFNGTNALTLNQNVASVAQPVTGLFVSGALSQIVCVLSRFPESMTFADAIAARQTAFFTARATEGFETSFHTRDAGADSGTRLLVRYSGFPGDARLAVPDLVAGSSAPTPTSAGEFGQPVAAGAAAPGALLLVRVVGTDANGAGGVLVNALGQPQFGALREVELRNGAGIAVYEAAGGSTVARESAEIPTFLDLRRIDNDGTPFASARVSLGPLSPAVASSTVVPRFADVAASTDCGVVRDCNAGYFPRLFVDPANGFTVSAPADAGAQVQYLRVWNESGGGLLAWTARIDYLSGGTNWLRIDRTSGFNNATIRLDLLAAQTAGPGTYRANVVVDAASQGSRTVPVTFTVTPRAVPVGPAVESVAHAATFEEFLVPGGLAMLRGVRLSGGNVAVKVGGATARLVYNSAEQINFEVPPSLAGRDTAELVVSVGGVDSAPRTVRLRAVLPGIFAGGIFNEDGSRNSESTPARIGGLVRLWFTGVPEAALPTVRVQVHDWEGLVPLTAAPVREAVGVSYADAVIPNGMPAMTSNVVVCASASSQAGAPAVCSLPVKISMVE